MFQTIKSLMDSKNYLSYFFSSKFGVTKTASFHCFRAKVHLNPMVFVIFFSIIMSMNEMEFRITYKFRTTKIFKMKLFDKLTFSREYSTPFCVYFTHYQAIYD